jgi:hypothetical protein
MVRYFLKSVGLIRCYDELILSDYKKNKNLSLRQQTSLNAGHNVTHILQYPTDAIKKVSL